MDLQSRSPDVPLWSGFLGGAPDSGPAKLPQLDGQRVLITGAGGYLGAATARALAVGGVAHLCLLDVVEHGLYDLQPDLEGTRRTTAYDLVLGSVHDPSLLRELLHDYKPTLVLHAAALKHVPMLESNALPAAATNVLGTSALLAAVGGSSVERVVLCSTDKAVAPVGVMGATKYLAEQLAFRPRREDRVTVLRLCNVLGATGSVAPRFASQIARAQPLTVTDRTATRLWISQAEAVRCLVEALVGSLPTPLAIPRHAEQHGILALAEFMMRRGKVANPQVVLTGLRRGERLHETLHTAGETPVENGSPSLRSLRPSRSGPQALEAVLRTIETAVGDRDHATLAQTLAAVLEPVREAIA